MSLVKRFHAAFGLAAPQVMPVRPDPDLVRFRARLIREEYEEVMKELAFLSHPQSPGDTVAAFQRLLKELADLRYVIDGCAVSFALPIDAAFEEVHRSNMTKESNPAGGKAIKGPDYSEADMKKLIPDIVEQEGPPA